MAKFSSTPARGMRDFTPAEMEIRNYVLAIILDTYRNYGFQQIETPSVESLDLLTNGDGGENVHLIYKILKRGQKLKLDNSNITESELADLGLRFDLTVPLVRFYAEHRGKLDTPFKSIQTGYVWRAERPQKGRFRQFVQCDIDIIGEKSCIAELQLILAASEALNKLGFTDFVIRINDRRILQELASTAGFPETEHEELFISLDKLDKIGMTGVKEECIKKGMETDKVNHFFDTIQNLIHSASFSQLLDIFPPSIPDEVLSDLQLVVDIVGEQAKVVYDPTLVRGMSYYTGQIYEIVSEGFSGSIAGGGRYDNMLGRFLKESEPACGISIGFERIFTILMEKGFQLPVQTKKLAYLYTNDDSDQLRVVFQRLEKLREQGYVVSLLPKRKNIRKQLDQLKRKGFQAFCFDGLDIREIV